MDGTRFDTIIKGLSTKRLTRLRAIRGVLGGAVAAATAVAVTGGVDAKRATTQISVKKNKRKTICHCFSNDPTTCKTRRIRRRWAHKHLKHLATTRGSARASPAARTCCLLGEQRRVSAMMMTARVNGVRMVREGA